MNLNQTPVAHDQIAALAHKFWEEDGRPEGYAEQHWLRAEHVLAGLKAQPVAAKKPAAKKAAKAKG